MANTIQMKRSAATGTTAPTGLAKGELAWLNNGANGGNGKLYIGSSDDTPQMLHIAGLGTGAVSASVVADDIGTGDGAVTLATSSGNITLDAQGNNTDIIFKGTDGGSDVTFLTLDGSEGGNAAFNGAIDCNTSLTIGSAVMTEADLEQLDGITAGTVAASKAVVVDSNKDAASFRNVTLTGTLTAADLDISGDVDVDGTLEADAMTLDGTAITTTATLSTGISNNNVPKFTSGVADNDFLRVDGTAIEGRSASEVLSDISAAPAAGDSNIVTTGALNSGSITSGFGNIDNGSSTLDTGALTATTITGVGDMTITGDTATFQSANSTDPLLIVKNTTNDANGARMRFVKDKGAAGADNDVAGVIEFVADDDAQAQTTFAKITASIADASNGAEGGKLSLGVATHDGEFQNGLILTDGSAEDEIDVTIGNGSSSVTTAAGDLVVTGDLTVSGSTTTVNTATMTVEDHNIVLGSGNSGSEVADATGLTFEGGSGDDVTFQYNATANRVELKHGSSFEDLKAGTITGTFSGNITGNVTGNTSGTAATVTGAAQSNITSLGTLTTLTVDNVIVNGTTIGHTDDTDLITLADTSVAFANNVDVNVAKAGGLQIAGTAVTSTAAELNILDGVTASATDLNLIDGITNGTVIASKAIITDSNKDISGGRNITISGELDAATGDFSGNVDVGGTFSIAGTNVTSTAAELNILDGVTATASELNIMDGVTSTTAELNVLDGITAVVGELNALDLGSTAVGNAIASKAVILDSSKDYTGIRNFTITGALDGATIDGGTF